MDDRKLRIQNLLINFLFFSSFCGLMLFTALYMTQRGFCASTIGLVLCLGNFLGSAEQGFLAKRADKKGGRALIRYGIFQLALAGTVFVPLFLRPTLPKAYIFFAFFLGVTNTISAQTTFSSLAMAYERAGKKIHFSTIRGVGSLGFAFSSVIMGKYFVSHSIERLPGILMILNFACIMMMLGLPTADDPSPEEKKNSSLNPSSLNPSSIDQEDLRSPSRRGYIKKYPIFRIFLGFVLIFMVYTFINNYLTVIVSFKGGDAGKAGFAAMIAAIAEMPALFFYLKLRARAKDSHWLMVCAIAFTVKAAILMMASNMGVLYLSQAVQFFSFGLFLPAFAYFINDLVEKEDLIQGQGIPIAIMSLGGGLGSLLGGFFIDRLGMGRTLELMTIFSAAGTLLAVFSLLSLGRKKLTQ